MNGEEFEKKWLKKFTPHLTQEQYNSCYIDQYLWHVFSFGVIPKEKVLIGDVAREAYEAVDKEGAITIQFDKPLLKIRWDKKRLVDIHTTEITEKYKNAKVVDKVQELYVVDKDWKWTYVSTHENGWCGPYFYRID